MTDRFLKLIKCLLTPLFILLYLLGQFIAFGYDSIKSGARRLWEFINHPVTFYILVGMQIGMLVYRVWFFE